MATGLLDSSRARGYTIGMVNDTIRTCAGRPHRAQPPSALLLVHAATAQAVGLGDADCWLCWPCYAALFVPSLVAAAQASNGVATQDPLVSEWPTTITEEAA